MDLAKWSDIVVYISKYTRIRELFALFCTCKAFRDISHSVNFWTARMGLYGRGAVCDAYPAIREECMEIHYNRQLWERRFCRRDIWKDVTKYKVCQSLIPGILRLSRRSWLISWDSFALRKLMYIGNKRIILDRISLLLTETQSRLTIAITLCLSYVYGKRLKKIVRKYLGRRWLKQTEAGDVLAEMMKEGSTTGDARGILIQWLNLEGDVQFILDDVIYIINMIELVRRHEKKLRIINGVIFAYTVLHEHETYSFRKNKFPASANDIWHLNCTLGSFGYYVKTLLDD